MNPVKNKTNFLEQMDYHVITIWECEINEAFEDIMQNVIDEILSFNDDDE